MKQGEIVEVETCLNGALKKISIEVVEIQNDLFSKKHKVIRGKRVFKNGRVCKTIKNY